MPATSRGQACPSKLPGKSRIIDFGTLKKRRTRRECRTTAELWEKQQRTDAGSLYQAAVCRAVTAAVLKEANAPGTDTARLAKDEADRAMTWLNKAVAAGYNDVAEMKTGKDLDTLRAARILKSCSRR